MISRYEQFVFLISGIYRSIQKMEREEMVRSGYKGAFVQYLAVLRRFPEGMTAAQLGEACLKDKAAVSRAVSEMMQKGLVRRACAGESGYRALLYLTDRGREAAEFISLRARQAVEEAGLTDDEREMLYTVLEKLSVNLQEISVKGLKRT